MHKANEVLEMADVLMEKNETASVSKARWHIESKKEWLATFLPSAHAPEGYGSHSVCVCVCVCLLPR